MGREPSPGTPSPSPAGIIGGVALVLALAALGGGMPWSRGPVPDSLKPAYSAFAQVAGQIGLSRLVANHSAQSQRRPPNLNDNEWAAINALQHLSTTFPNLTKEVAALPQSAEEARAAGALGDIPEHQRIREDLLRQLAALSSRGHIVWAGDEFFLQYRAPDIIAAAVTASMTFSSP